MKWLVKALFVLALVSAAVWFVRGGFQLQWNFHVGESRALRGGVTVQNLEIVPEPMTPVPL